MKMELTDMIIAATVSSIIPIFLSLAIHYFKHRQNNSTPKPRGSNGWLIMGETLEYLSTTKAGIPEKFINDRRQRHNSKVFKTSLLGQQMALLCNAEGNKFIFSNENKLVSSWWPSSVDKFFDTQHVSKIQAATQMRRFVTPVLKPDTLRKYVGIVDKTTRQHLQANWVGNDVVKVYPFAKDLTFALACRLLLGIEDNGAISELQKPFCHFSAGLLSLPVDLPGTNFRRDIKAAKELRREFEKMVRQWRSEAEAEVSSKNLGMLSQHMLDIFNDEKDISVSESEVATRMLALISASYDNVSTAMTFVVKYLAEMPDVYDAGFKEQQDIARAKRKEEALNWDDIQKMRYSWNVASEVLRLHPPSNGAFREVIMAF